jgi:hypothetical protein
LKGKNAKCTEEGSISLISKRTRCKIIGTEKKTAREKINNRRKYSYKKQEHDTKL